MIDKQTLGTQDPYVTFTAGGQKFRTTTKDAAGKYPEWEENFLVNDLEEYMMDSLIFETKDEDYIGFKPLGNTDENFRLLDLLNKIIDFDPRILQLDLRDKDRFAGTLLIQYEAVSKEREKALALKQARDNEAV